MSVNLPYGFGHEAHIRGCCVALMAGRIGSTREECNTFYGQNVNSRGVAQAKAVLFFVLVATIGLIQLGYTRKKEVQQ